MCALAEELAARPDNHLLLGHIDGDEGVVFISDDGGPPAVALLLEIEQLPVAGPETLHLPGGVEMRIEQGKQGIELFLAPARLAVPELGMICVSLIMSG